MDDGNRFEKSGVASPSAEISIMGGHTFRAAIFSLT